MYDAVALLGTNLSDGKVQEIADGKYKHVYLCLDQDATYTAVKMTMEWRHKLPNMRMLGLQKDIKNMNDEEFEEFLGRLP